MLVKKRNGSTEPFSKMKLRKFLNHTGETGPESALVDSIVKGLPSEIHLDSLHSYLATTAQAAGKGLIAGRIEMLKIHKQTSESFTRAMLSLPLDPDFLKKIEKVGS